ncbi:hypothetical protein GDO86_000782 [Hymenochirus boettgeri]|uniref:SOWAHA-C winged helix-turn-helix domain-containing protein n=1 Tax=Hymenochirus boettgeri TaxID=247094 RepID=A0A8T2KFU6_9PIPI|nr:hypothetical protein GDO86_000782 [Hymenochirus boettgeri]
MAKDLSQEEVLDFLCHGGGKVSNAALLGHFKRFLRDPQAPGELQLKRREKFKRCVNSVAVVKEEAGVKYVVLKSRYRDLVGEEIQPVPSTVNQPIHLDPQCGEGWNSPSGVWQGGELVIGTCQCAVTSSGNTWKVNGAVIQETVSAGTDSCYPEGITPPSLPVSPEFSRSLESTFTSRSPEITPPPKINHSLSSNNLTSSFSSADSPGLPAPCSVSPSHIAEAENSASLKVTCRDPLKQKEECLSCIDLLAPCFKCDPPQHLHTTQEHCSDNLHREKHTYNSSLSNVSSPSSYPEHIPPPSPFLLPQEIDTIPDVQLVDDNPACSYPENDMYGVWMCQLPVFKSIRCQLSLHDLDDYVDQESCESEDSDSGDGADCDTEPKDGDEDSSDAHTTEDMIKDFKSCSPNRNPSSNNDHSVMLQNDAMVIDCTIMNHGDTSSARFNNSESVYTKKSFLSDQAPVLYELAGRPSWNRTSSHFQEAMSSSDEELIDRDHRKRRRPSHSKKLTNVSLFSVEPEIGIFLTPKPVQKDMLILNDISVKQPTQAQYEPKGNNFDSIKSSYQKSYVVPLDPKEHDWIVKTASGSWIQVYGMFIMDPGLSLHKDFITGFTALHWFAKHGCTDMFHKFVAGANKAGIELDLNVKSSSGYTPLHVAAIHGHYKVAAMLVEKLKVNVKVRDNSGKRAWQYLSSTTSGELWQLLGAPKGKTIFASRALNATQSTNSHKRSSQLNRKTSLAAFCKPQHQKWKANNLPSLRERDIYSD